MNFNSWRFLCKNSLLILLIFITTSITILSSCGDTNSDVKGKGDTNSSNGNNYANNSDSYHKVAFPIEYCDLRHTDSIRVCITA